MENYIELSNIDGKIWNLQERVIDIISILTKYGNCHIGLDGEGPCADALGLYRLLDYVCDHLSISRDSITIHTLNQIEIRDRYPIKFQPPLYVVEDQQFYRKHQHTFKEKDPQSMKTLGLFIGRSNYLRLWLASEIDSKYKDKTLMTFHHDRGDDFNRPHCGIDDMINQGLDFTVVENAVRFLASCPRRIPDENVTYPILTPSNLDICKYYDSFFCELVCETFFSGNSFYPTEKIWRPLMMKTPFIVQGPMYYLDNLKKLGFRTFDRWWNEGHQHDPYDYQPTAILEVVRYIMSLSTKELQDVYEDMIPTLQHNHDRFMELQNDEFSKIFGY